MNTAIGPGTGVPCGLRPGPGKGPRRRSRRCPSAAKGRPSFRWWATWPCRQWSGGPADRARCRRRPCRRRACATGPGWRARALPVTPPAGRARTGAAGRPARSGCWPGRWLCRQRAGGRVKSLPRGGTARGHSAGRPAPVQEAAGGRTAAAAGYAKRARRHTVGMWGTVWFTCRWQWQRCWWRRVPVTVRLRRALNGRRRGRALLRRARLKQVWPPRTGVLGSRRSARYRFGHGRGSTRRIWPCRM